MEHVAPKIGTKVGPEVQVTLSFVLVAVACDRVILASVTGLLAAALNKGARAHHAIDIRRPARLKKIRERNDERRTCAPCKIDMRRPAQRVSMCGY